MSIWANQILVLSANKEINVSFLTEQGYVAIVRDAPSVEGDMASLSICSCNFVGFIYMQPTRTLSLGELSYVLARIRKVNCV